MSTIICSECKNQASSKIAFHQYNAYFCSRPCLLKRREIELAKQKKQEEEYKKKPRYNQRCGDYGGLM